MQTTWAWLGDHLALDVANTVYYLDGARYELLATPADLEMWCAAEPQAVPRPDTFGEEDLGRFRGVRDAAHDVLHAASRRDQLPTRASAHIDRCVLQAQVSRVLSLPGTLSRFVCPEHVPPVTQMVGVAAAAVVDLVGRDDLANLAVCHAPSCGQFFHRARPNQRWCSPGCGNRARVDRHRHRVTRSAQPEASPTDEVQL